MLRDRRSSACCAIASITYRLFAQTPADPPALPLTTPFALPRDPLRGEKERRPRLTCVAFCSSFARQGCKPQRRAVN